MKIELKKPKCFGRMYLPEVKRCLECRVSDECFNKTFFIDEK